ncbi:site-specific integrase [Empedobacter sp.]|uniref:tyrosine-type recombinase/integrase n=1 Tax=Empedobacter sp. TaxID=1927715 RepID=UPI00289B2127|nr:site-specific integrase [Empedobacter sp.]
MKKNNWTEPKIKTYPIPGKDWYVWFRFNGGNPKRFSTGINDSDSYDQRMENAVILQQTIKLELEAGWNPDLKNTNQAKPKKVKFSDAIDFSLEKLKLRVSIKTYRDYSGTCRFVKSAAEKLKYINLGIDTIERFHIKNIFETIQSQRKWSNHAYNKNLGYFKSILSELVEYNLIKDNPAHGIRTLKYDTPPTEFPTDKEQSKIIKHLHERNFSFLRFVKALYQTGIRPAELLRLKVGDVDLIKDMILLRPEDGKTNKYRLVPIKPDLRNDLVQIISFNHSDDLYLFGTPRLHGGHLDHSNMFCPNPYKIKRDTVTKYWKKYVKDELEIDKKLYSLKHKAANDMMFDGVDLETIQTIFGHSKTKTTEIYANQINLVRFEKAKKAERKFI